MPLLFSSQSRNEIMTSFLMFEDPVLLKVRRMAFVQESLRHIGSEAFSLHYLLSENGAFPSIKQTDNKETLVMVIFL